MLSLKMTNPDEPNLFTQLRKIQLEWQMKPDQMAALAHVSLETFQGWFQTSAPAMSDTGSIPPGMQSAVVLVSI